MTGGVDESSRSFVSIFNHPTLPIPFQTERHLKYHAKYYFKPEVEEAHVRMVVNLQTSKFSSYLWL
jgi:hypothetical protein